MKKKIGEFFAKLSPPQIITLSFATMIFIGAVLLVLPFSSAEGQWTSFVTALFTATSATCVTGLTLVETGTYFSLTGKIVILCLIQLGGLGIMTIVSLFSVIFVRTSSIKNRNIAMQATGAIAYNEIKGLLGRIITGTFIFELIGAGLLTIRFIPQYGVRDGIWISVFTSISAFCNAGFDLFGTGSLMTYSADPLVMLTISFLIIMGGIGYITWYDVTRKGFKFKYYSLHSKIALTMAGALLLFGTVMFMLTDYNKAFAGQGFFQTLLNAFFQSVTLRTAGFYSVDQATLSNGGVLVCYILMFIGGTAGSTAGGLKTTTFAVIFFTYIANVRHSEDVVAFKRTIPSQTVKSALSIALSYLSILFIATIVILSIDGTKDGVTTQNVLFEAISAVATVGVTRGITATLSIASQLVITFLMFVGRIGGFTFVLLFSSLNPKTTTRPKEDLLIG